VSPYVDDDGATGHVLLPAPQLQSTSDGGGVDIPQVHVVVED